MENRSVQVVAGLIGFLLLASGAAWADEADPQKQADWQARMDRAAVMQAESREALASAEREYKAESLACADKFLVNPCRENAHQAYLKASRAARRAENEGKALERAVKKEQRDDLEARNAAEMPQRLAEQQARQASVATARQTAVAREAAQRESKARQAAAGERRKAADAEKAKQKQAAHEARVAEKKRSAERRAAETKP